MSRSRRKSFLRCAVESLGGGLIVSLIAAGAFFANCDRTPRETEQRDSKPIPVHVASAGTVPKHSDVP